VTYQAHDNAQSVMTNYYVNNSVRIQQASCVMHSWASLEYVFKSLILPMGAFVY